MRTIHDTHTLVEPGYRCDALRSRHVEGGVGGNAPITTFMVDAPAAIRDVETKDGFYVKPVADVSNERCAQALASIAWDFNASLGSAHD